MEKATKFFIPRVKAMVMPIKKKSPEIDLVHFNLCDKNANQNAQRVADFLNGVSKKGFLLYGHQNDLHRKAGVKGEGFSQSDTFDMTGEYAGVTGIDALSLTGTEHGRWNWSRQNRISAAVELTMGGLENGAILSFSAHMPNFQLIYDRLSKMDNCFDEAFSNTDDYSNPILADGSVNYSGYTPNDLSGNVMAQILPNEKLNQLYTGYLDLICDYFSEIDKRGFGAIWRPFHENTGHWFWWGTKCCSAELFKEVWRYTWDYMTNQRGIHNLIWAYSPGSENKTVEDFLERYPGDEFVDLVGFDCYQQYPDFAEKYWIDFEEQCKMISSFALRRNKLFANTETGVAHPDFKALLSQGNEDFRWYEKVSELCKRYGACYFLLWANFSSQGAFYSPYVTEKKVQDGKIVYLEGHELLDSFVRMYNSPFMIFSDGMRL